MLNNQIVDSFPSWMGTLPKLRILVLRSNQLNGTIHDLHHGNQHFKSLQIVNLASNHFSGVLHSEWFENLKAMMNTSNDEGQIIEAVFSSFGTVYQDTVILTFKDAVLTVTKIQTALKVIDFSNNSFEGFIPSSIGRLVSLHGLNMSYNKFTGRIPSQLGSLTRLESLDLSCNSLSGNAGLCEIQVSKECDTLGTDSSTTRALAPEPNTLWQDRLDAIILFICTGVGFGVGFALAILFGHEQKLQLIKTFKKGRASQWNLNAVEIELSHP
ncbi:hypothetical protein HU200_000389 [Digitaria exilis]|uniref:Uncharacterized protein n=1 Tax=Digitaria exilis TaxID=1010633 RepID=A0A835KYH4_9POAL|nr:hypothetical protein HU200_000389 [Digitaria exilis]